MKQTESKKKAEWPYMWSPENEYKMYMEHIKMLTDEMNIRALWGKS